MANISYYTEAGLQQLKDELHVMKTQERNKIAEQLAEARGQGDLSENAEYDAAKDAQGMLEMKIHELEQSLFNARVLSTADIDTSKVSILSNVRIKHKQLGKEISYTIVSKEEADIKTGKISVESPIGNGLLGKRVGEAAVIDIPSGKVELEILAISL